jgi:hypothetical protein
MKCWVFGGTKLCVGGHLELCFEKWLCLTCGHWMLDQSPDGGICASDCRCLCLMCVLGVGQASAWQVDGPRPYVVKETLGCLILSS